MVDQRLDGKWSEHAGRPLQGKTLLVRKDGRYCITIKRPHNLQRERSVRCQVKRLGESRHLAHYECDLSNVLKLRDSFCETVGEL